MTLATLNRNISSPSLTKGATVKIVHTMTSKYIVVPLDIDELDVFAIVNKGDVREITNANH